MTPTPPCVCGHLATLHMPHGGGGRCTGAGCDCRAYARRTTLPDELLPPAAADRCPTCQGRNRHTTDMVCMACGRDYMPDDGSHESAPGLGWKRLMGLWREQCKQAEADRDIARAEADEMRTQRDTAREHASAVCAERDYFTAALARVEAFADLCTDVTAREIRAAIAGDTPPAEATP